MNQANQLIGVANVIGKSSLPKEFIVVSIKMLSWKSKEMAFFL